MDGFAQLRDEYEYWQLFYASMGQGELFSLKFLRGYETVEEYLRYGHRAVVDIPTKMDEYQEYREELVNG